MRYLWKSALMSAGLALTSHPAFAHHVMGGTVPDTMWAGLLSGFGHPIIGIDHFAFIIGVGIISALVSQRVFMPLFFIAATVIGCVFHLAGAVVAGIGIAFLVETVEGMLFA